VEIHPYRFNTGVRHQLNLSEEEILKKGFRDGGLWFDNTNTIICGTFPPLKEYFNRTGYLHYSSAKNKFWKHVDNIYYTKLYIPTLLANNNTSRIENAIKKIDFLQSKKLGFIDIFTKIERRNASSKDRDIVSKETIFDNNIFSNALQQDVVQFGFVYSLSRDTFEFHVKQITNKAPTLYRKYNTNNIPLEIKVVTFRTKEIFLSYSPIHGRIPDERKRDALRKVINMDFD
jgi:G:T/U-mismatch repair DNA glycosylase